MDRTERFRRTMRCRLRDAAWLAILAAPILHGVACAKVVVDGEPSGQGGAGGGTGGAGGAGGDGVVLPAGSGGLTVTSTGTGCMLTSTGTSGIEYQLTECIAKVDNKCPTQYQVTKYIVPSLPCSYVVSVDCGPVPQDEICCYLVTEQGGGCP